MNKVSKEFKKALIDNDISMKDWCKQNEFDIYRLRNIFNKLVKPNKEEVEKIQNYCGMKNIKSRG